MKALLTLTLLVCATGTATTKADELGDRMVRAIHMSAKIRSDVKAGKDVQASVNQLKAEYQDIKSEFLRRHPGFAHDVEEILYLAQIKQPMSVLKYEPEHRSEGKHTTAAFECVEALRYRALFSLKGEYDLWHELLLTSEIGANQEMYVFHDTGFAVVPFADAEAKGCARESALFGTKTYYYDMPEKSWFTGEIRDHRYSLMHYEKTGSLLQGLDGIATSPKCYLPPLQNYDQAAIDKLNGILAHGIENLANDYKIHAETTERSLNKVRPARRDYLEALNTCAKVGSPAINAAIEKARRDFALNPAEAAPKLAEEPAAAR